MHENHVVIYEKVAHRSWFEETKHGMSKAMKTLVAKEVMGAGAAVTAAGVAAAGVAAALATTAALSSDACKKAFHHQATTHRFPGS